MDPGTAPVSAARVTYVDTSALARAYLADEAEHETLRARILGSADVVVTWALSLVEMTSAIRSAQRAGRIGDADHIVAGVARDMVLGRVIPLTGDPGRLLDRAQDLCDRHPLRALDAMHLAVALHDAGDALPDADVVFLTRDDAQAEAARREGLLVE